MVDYYLVETARGPAWDDAKVRPEQDGWPEHAAFVDALVDEGFVVVGGPVGDLDGDRALLVVRAGGEDEVRERLAADPWAETVLSISSVRPWTLWLGRELLTATRRPLPSVSDAPDLRMLNVVVSDMAASVEFYRLLGLGVVDSEVADTTTATDLHVQLRAPGGFSLELDTAESAGIWHAGWRSTPSSVSVVVGFALPSREAVDERYAALTAAGHRGRQPPFDAFWGARYAIVRDPDGNDIGLMSPVDDSRRSWPPAQSPDP